MTIMAVWPETSWAFPESCTANESRSGCLNNGNRQEDKSMNSELQHQSEFQHQKYAFESAHESNQEHVVRTFVGHC